jgi:hypothetical protein
MLSAIADVESGNNAAKRGHHGERTQLQIMPATWSEFSRMPHSIAASNPVETDRVARAYLAVIRSNLRARGLPETPFFIAAGWNAGARWKRLHRSTVSYAERVANLADTAQAREIGERYAVTPATLERPLFVAILPKLATKDGQPHHALVARIDDIPEIRIASTN